ncbi:FAD-dependent hydroxylase [Candidatus Synechococcus calcipolaris G9]|uniref:FAD-dependent hydroxylase n=1 Tax=Candidatus Synechococcus calcipolaris G9 TaxID=1497997 RepID=A0ABT6F159_9SYNE|nr:FAD-dependent hydroxylase [Candidatus Synechococcus calcipolaris]MDG2991513.1 FAD-dependent hydroxylase [Candidatus Synechococcus calcipolaris G9]
MSAQPPSPQVSVDVAIVGAGIVGLTLACALRDSGLKIAIIEAQPEAVAIAKGQAYALHQVARQIFSHLGVWQALYPRIQAFDQVRLSDGTYPQTVEFLTQDLGADAIGYVAEHHVLAETLRNALAHSNHIQWFCPWWVSDFQLGDKVGQLTLVPGDTSQQVAPTIMESSLVVAADGGRSPLRQTVGITTQGWPYWQSCVVATLKLARSHPAIAYERFWPTGPLGVLPLTGDRYRIVWTLPHAQAQEMLALDDAEFLEKLIPHLDPTMADVTLQGKRFLFPTRLMHTRSYWGDRLVLVGDAAHTCHPVGGQGLNLGLRDVNSLADALITAHQQGKDIGDPAVLRAYHRRRTWENWLTLAFTDLLNRLFSNQFLGLVSLRRFGLYLLQILPPLKQMSLRFMAGILFEISDQPRNMSP